MKKLFAITLVILALISCEKDETPKTAPVLPPAETMAIDLSHFQEDEKSASLEKTNWFYSAATVGVWNVIIGTTFAIPVAAFKTAFDHQAEWAEGTTWQWQYTVDGFTSQYAARLTGEVLSGEVEWKMYVTKTGVDSFEEFLWFEGTSQADGNSGQWILYHSPAFPQKTVQIDWEKQADAVGEIKYTYVREKNNQGNDDPFHGSHLTYGLKEGEHDIFVNVHAWDGNSQEFHDSFIEWNRTGYFGRVKAEHFFEDADWHCWDSQGNDVGCE